MSEELEMLLLLGAEKRWDEVRLALFQNSNKKPVGSIVHLQTTSDKEMREKDVTEVAF